jgi:ADP-heptose:LPS heptosyltransferase
MRILVVKLADLGDALTITPALRALRSRFPTARIDVLVTRAGAEALAGLDTVDNTVRFEKSQFDRRRPSVGAIRDALALGLRLRRQRYDRVFLCHHLFTAVGRAKYTALLAATGAPWRAGVAETRPGFLTEVAREDGYGVQHEADYWLAVAGLAGAENPCPRLEIAVPASARDRAAALVAESGLAGNQLIAIYPGAGSYSLARRWPLTGFAEAGRQLLAEDPTGDRRIVVVGGPDERGVAEELSARLGPRGHNLAGQTDLKTLAALLQRCDLFIGNDGGAMHVAVAAGVPVVAIFGPSNHVSWGPYGARVWGEVGAHEARSLVIRHDLPCSPCLYRGYVPGTPWGCRARDCLTLIVPDQVVAAAEHLLAHRVEQDESSAR